MSKKTEWKKTNKCFVSCSLLPMTQQREDFINQCLSLLNSFIFKMAPTGSTFSMWRKLFSFGANGGARKKISSGNPAKIL